MLGVNHQSAKSAPAVGHNAEAALGHHLCPICHESFVSLLERNTHMKSHLGQNLYRCIKCGFSSPKKSAVDAHVYQCATTVDRTTPLQTQQPNSVSHKVHRIKRNGDGSNESNIGSQHNETVGKDTILCHKATALAECTENGTNEVHNDISINEDVTMCRDGPHVCVLCGDEFDTWDAVNSHLQTHNVETSQNGEDRISNGWDKLALDNVETSHNSEESVSNNECNLELGSVEKTEDVDECVCDEEHTPQHQSDSCRGPQGKGTNCVCKNECDLPPNILPPTAALPMTSCQELRVKAAASNHTNESTGFCSQRDEATHTGEKPYPYTDCGNQFMNASTVETHMITHQTPISDVQKQDLDPSLKLNARADLVQDKESEYTCTFCSQQFGSKSATKVHMVSTRGSCAAKPKKHRMIHTGEKPHKCPHCGKRFTQLVYLKRHMMIHTGEKPYKCHDCGKQFTRAGNLKTHMMTHTGEKPHKCSDCGEQFALACNLKTHMMTHTGEKPYRCSDSKSCFQTPTEFRSHIKHTGQNLGTPIPDMEKQNLEIRLNLEQEKKTGYLTSVYAIEEVKSKSATTNQMLQTGGSSKLPLVYECSYCNKKFMDNIFLRKHMKLHAEECSEKQQFIYASTFNKHMMTHIGGTPHQCSQCGKRFVTASTLESHMRTHTLEGN